MAQITSRGCGRKIALAAHSEEGPADRWQQPPDSQWDARRGPDQPIQEPWRSSVALEAANSTMDFRGGKSLGVLASD